MKLSIRIILLIRMLLLFHCSLYSQEITSYVKNNNTAYLYSIKGNNFFFVDSIKKSREDFTFPERDTLASGLYRLRFNDDTWLDFIYDKKEEFSDFENSSSILESQSNKIYYQFLEYNNTYKIKSELLRYILYKYPERGDYYQLTVNELEKLNYNYLKFTTIDSQEKPNSFVARYIKSSQLSTFNPSFTYIEQQEYLHANALNKTDFHDSELIRSDCFTNKVIEYLNYFKNPQLPKHILEKKFIIAVDSILTKAKVNDMVYKHIIEYLLEGFEQYGFTNILEHIINNHVIKGNLCLSNKIGLMVNRRIHQSKQLSPGKAAPPISLRNENGKLIDLEKLDFQKLLIIFYTSSCSHCVELIPKIYEIYKEYSSLTVAAISLDENQREWHDFILSNNLDWLNLSDLKGWESPVAKAYFVYGTPTMFFIDNKYRIINIPKNITEIKKEL